MPYTQDQLDSLEEAITIGATSVSYEGKSVTYRSLDDMLQLRRIMRESLGISSGKATTQFVAHDRGFR